MLPSPETHARLAALNPRTRIEAIGERISSANVEALLDGVDVVIDGSLKGKLARLQSALTH